MAIAPPVPAELVQKLKRAEKAFDDLHHAFEDYHISTNPRLLEKLRRSRRDQLAGRTRPFEDPNWIRNSPAWATASSTTPDFDRDLGKTRPRNCEVNHDGWPDTLLPCTPSGIDVRFIATDFH